MKTYRCHNIAVIVMLLVILFSLTGCSKKEPEKKPQEQSQNTQNESQEPESFTKLVKETDTLIMGISKKVNFIEMPVQQEGSSGQQQQGQQQQGQQQQGQQQQGQQQQGQQQQGQQQQGQQQQGQQQQGQQQQGQQQQGQQQQGQQQQGQQQQGQQQQGQQQQGQQQQDQTQTQQSSDEWSKERESIRKINQQWNSLEPSAIKAGLTPEVRDQFEKTMEDLTMSINDKKTQPSLMGAIELYRSYADMASALKSKTPPPYFRVKYEVLMIAALATVPQWEVAREHATALMQNWDMLKMKDEGQNSETFSKTEYSLNDVKRAVELKQKQLVMIKSEIAMQNLEELKSKLTQNGGQSSSSGQQGQQGSSQNNSQGGGQS